MEGRLRLAKPGVPAGKPAGQRGRQRRRGPAVLTAVLFLALWLGTGFALGTSLMLGPLRAGVDALRARGASETAETLLALAAMAGLVAATAALSVWLVGRIRHVEHPAERYGIPLLVLACAGAALALWLQPGAVAALAPATTQRVASFTFGPYPDEAALRLLKADGYDAVITLLHPAVVPFEPKLLADEREAAARVGIDLVELPMLPWISGNEDALERIRELARARRGRYYVHCYLGVDRVHLVRRTVEQEAAPAETGALTGGRDLDAYGAFERGPIVRLDGRGWLTPFPSDDEMLSYIVGSKVRTVISLLDPGNPEDVPWIDREIAALEPRGVEVRVHPVPVLPFEPHRAREAARAAHLAPGPVLVHAFLPATGGRAPAAEAFLQAFRTDRLPLPPALFAEPLAGGPVEVLAPSVAAGPRPAGPEFGAVLAPRGVRTFVWLGSPEAPEATEDRRLLRGERLDWRVAQASEVPALVADGGPYYLYGPGLEEVRGTIVRLQGPAVPDALVFDPQRLRPPPSLRPAERLGIPDLPTIVLYGPLLILVTLLAAFVAARLKDRGVRTPYTRKVFHFAIFSTAGVLHLTSGLQAVMLFGGIVTLAVLHAVWRGDGFPFYEAMARETDAPRRALFVLVPLATTAVGGLLANLLFGALAPIGYLVAGWGDAVGEPVGARWGKHRFKVPSLADVPATRSLEGSAAVTVCGMAAAVGGLLLFGATPGAALLAGAAAGAAGAAVEAFSPHGLDNLTIQLAAAGTAWLVM